MNPAKGYYSLVQYCPDLGRLEAANVGVLLFCPERKFLKVAMSSHNRRIRQFFGDMGHDWVRINDFKKGLVERISQEAFEIRTLDDLNQFIALRANLLQITPPRSMKVFDPEVDLKQLAHEFLGESEHRTAQHSLKKSVTERFKIAGLEGKVQTNIRVEVPVLRREVEIPFGFQNGRFNLLAVVPFEAKNPEQSVNTACKYAVEGNAFYNRPDPTFGELQFCVLGQFKPGDEETSGRVKDVFAAHHVKLYRHDQIAVLIDEIRRTARDAPQLRHPM